MKPESSAVKTREEQREQALETSASGVDTVSKGVIVTMGVVSALVGIWAVACFVGAMVMTESSPLAMIGSWFRAISGM